MELEYKFFRVTQQPSYGNDKAVFDVCNRRTGDILGVLEWYPRWKRYCLFPVGDCVRSADCLRDIIDAIEKVSNEQVQS